MADKAFLTPNVLKWARESARMSEEIAASKVSATPAKLKEVTKENLVTAVNSKQIKIPNVCENMGIRWIDDFAFVKEIGLTFSCKL